MQRMQQGPCCMMAAQDGEGRRIVLGPFAYKGAFGVRAMVDDRDSKAKVSETVGYSETGWVSPKNHDGLGGSGSHEDRERNHTPAATTSRRLAASRARGPNIRCLGSSSFFNILKYTARMISATVTAFWSLAGRSSNAACAFA